MRAYVVFNTNMRVDIYPSVRNITAVMRLYNISIDMITFLYGNDDLTAIE